MKDLRDRVSETRDLFAYLIVYAPELPAEDRTTLDAEIAMVRDNLGEIADHLSKSAHREWLNLALREVDEAKAAFEAGAPDKGIQLLQAAEGHFLNLLRNKSSRPEFVVDPGGKARKT